MPASQRFAPAVRLAEVKSILEGVEGASIYDIAERLGVSERTALRYVQAVEASGVPLYEEIEGRRKVWRVVETARGGTLHLTLGQMVTLFFVRRVLDFLRGTGFKEDFDEIFRKVEAGVRHRDRRLAKNLDRKFFDRNEGPHKYRGRHDDMNDLMTALLYEERLTLRHERVGNGRTEFLVEPYTLLVYRKGLYLIGKSEAHGGIHRLDLDGVRHIERRRGDRFEYPTDYSPESFLDGPFGVIRGPRAHVRIFFTDKVARYLRRRTYHPTQKIHRVEGGIEVTMTVDGTTELTSWVMSFGEQAEVLEPPELRAEVGGELARAAAQYAGAARRRPPTRRG